MPSCYVKSCKNRSEQTKCQNIRYFGFPRDPELCEKWLDACQNERWNLQSNLKNARVCSVHFTQDCFEKKGEHLIVPGDPIWKRFSLKRNAVPTENLGYEAEKKSVKKQRKTNAERQKHYRQRQKEKEKEIENKLNSNPYYQQSEKKKPKTHAERQAEYQKRKKDLQREKKIPKTGAERQRQSRQRKKERLKERESILNSNASNSDHQQRKPSTETSSELIREYCTKKDMAEEQSLTTNQNKRINLIIIHPQLMQTSSNDNLQVQMPMFKIIYNKPPPTTATEPNKEYPMTVQMAGQQSLIKLNDDHEVPLASNKNIPFVPLSSNTNIPNKPQAKTGAERQKEYRMRKKMAKQQTIPQVHSHPQVILPANKNIPDKPLGEAAAECHKEYHRTRLKMAQQQPLITSQNQAEATRSHSEVYWNNKEFACQQVLQAKLDSEYAGEEVLHEISIECKKTEKNKC